MAIPNVNQLTSQLRMLPDPALRQAAMMYKNDPYILPMIISEDTARKQMRMVAQSQIMGQEPPKVVDQAVAAIGQMPQPQMPQPQMPPQGPGGPMPQGGPMPPQGGPRPPMPPQGAGPAPGGPGGIAALQAPNMQRMADGGIAGYPDEDEIVGMAEGGVARYNGATGSVTSALEQAQMPVMQNLQSLQAQLGQAEQMLAAAAKSGDPQSLKYYAQAVQALRTQLATVAEQNFGNRATEVMSGLSAAPAAVPTRQGKTGIADIDVGPSMAPAAAAPAAAPRPGPGAATRPVAAAPAAPAAPAAAAPSAAMAPPTVAGAKETAAQFLDRQEIERQSQQYLKDEESAVNQARMRREAALANRGQAYTGLEALLKKEEEGSKGQLEQSKAFAIINAGLAMMAGSSPNALKNIAEGAMVGTKQYQGAISDFNKAAKERQKALADIEQARRAEDRADTDAQLKFEERADERMANARKFGVDALMGAGIKNAEIATKIYDTQVTQAGQDRRTQMEITGRAAEGEKTRQTQVQIANIQAGTRDSPLALYRELGDGDIKRGFEIAQEGKVGGSLIKAIVEGVLKNPLMMREYPPAVQQLVNQELLKLGVSSGVTSNPPANAQILK